MSSGCFVSSFLLVFTKMLKYMGEIMLRRREVRDVFLIYDCTSSYLHNKGIILLIDSNISPLLKNDAI